MSTFIAVIKFSKLYLWNVVSFISVEISEEFYIALHKCLNPNIYCPA